MYYTSWTKLIPAFPAGEKNVQADKPAGEYQGIFVFKQEKTMYT